METAIDKRTSVLPAHVAQDRVIQRLPEAEQALGFAATVDQVKLVMDAAAAQEVFAKRQQLGEDVIRFAHVIKSHALARLGELLKAMDKAVGTRGQLTGDIPSGSPLEPPGKTAPTLADLGISKKISHIAQRLADQPPEIREAIAQQEMTLAQALRERKAVEIRRTVQLPDAKFRVLYADPPWSYNDKADDGAIQSGGAEMHYPSMSMAELCAMPIAPICEPNAVLFLWVTSPLLFECAPVIKAWGFTYKASFVWDKVKHNLGHYNSVRHEFLLICTRGSCTPDVVVNLLDSVQSIERTTHSTKPEAFRTIIETLYPHGKRLELFARRTVEGWATFGNQVEATA
jgi:N6-adenosine-specific RNA methylase IME4